MRRLFTLPALLLCAIVLAAPSGAAEPPAQKFVVFFQEWSAALDEASQAAIAQAAASMKDHPKQVARVAGFADPTGSKKANALLSDLRAQMVVDALVADGVDEKRIRQRGHGSVEFALSSLESRRVEISFGKR